jgi:chemotaxis protein CheD
MAEIIEIKTAELYVGHNDQVIRTGSVGSCVVIALFDTEKRVGGLAHAMLPHRKNNLTGDKYPARYVDEAINNLLEGLKAVGANKKNILAKLVGGASMFKKLTEEKNSIGSQNIQMARQKLQELGIPIDGEDTGGSSGKMVIFDLKTGIVDVSTAL